MKLDISSIEKLNKILDVCKSSIHIDINNHMGGYQAINDYMKQVYGEEYTSDQYEKFNNIIKNNSIVEIQIYPKSSVAFYKFFSHDFNVCIDEIYDTLKKEEYFDEQTKLL